MRYRAHRPDSPCACGLVLGCAVLLALPPAHAQQSLAATLGVYAFPKAGQTKEEQSKAEAECYEWAVQSAGNDPFDLARQSEQTAAKAEVAREQAARKAKQGSALRGAMRGAATGALIGGITDNRAGQGSAWGAAAGALGGKRKGRRRSSAAARQVDASASQAMQADSADIENFKKAFSVCLEAKEYLVKF